MTATPKPPMTNYGLLWRAGVLGVFTVIVAYMLGLVLFAVAGGAGVDFSAHSQRAWRPAIGLVSILLATAMSGAQTAMWAARGSDETKALGVLRLVALAGAPPIVIAGLLAAQITWAAPPSAMDIVQILAAFVVGPFTGVLVGRTWVARRAVTAATRRGA